MKPLRRRRWPERGERRSEKVGFEATTRNQGGRAGWRGLGRPSSGRAGPGCFLSGLRTWQGRVRAGAPWRIERCSAQLSSGPEAASLDLVSCSPNRVPPQGFPSVQRRTGSDLRWSRSLLACRSPHRDLRPHETGCEHLARNSAGLSEDAIVPGIEAICPRSGKFWKLWSASQPQRASARTGFECA